MNARMSPAAASQTKWVSPSGRVTLLAPSGSSPYYRLTWRDLDNRRGQTHVGQDYRQARVRAQDKERVLAAGDPGALAASRVGDLLDAYLDPSRPKFERSRPERGRAWSDGYSASVAKRVEIIRARVGHLRLEKLTQRDISAIVNSRCTYGQALAMRTTCRGIVQLGLRRGYLRPDQQYLADVDVIVNNEPRAERLTRYLEQGENVLLIADWEVPTHEQVRSLARATVPCDHWEGMVHVLAYAGPRIHEALALTADDVIEVSRPSPDEPAAEDRFVVLAVTKQVTEPSGGGVKLTAPKNGRVRRTTVPEVTPTGFPLASWLLERASQARAEKDGGRNPHALLFPSRRGGKYWRLNNLHHRVFVPAALMAGWKFELFEGRAHYYQGGQLVVRDATHRVFLHPLHSLRHRFATTARDDWNWGGEVLCRAGGWSSEEFVSKRYYGTTQEILERAARSQAHAVAQMAAQQRPTATGAVDERFDPDREGGDTVDDEHPGAHADTEAEAAAAPTSARGGRGLGCEHA